MISRIELNNNESFDQVVELEEYIDNSTTANTIVIITIGENPEDISPDVSDINVKFTDSLENNNINVYLKDSELSEEYLDTTFAGFTSIRSVVKSNDESEIVVVLVKN